MTEAEWLACEDVKTLLEYLVGRASDRKFRLFGCACCRRIWDLLKDDRAKRAVEIAERHADDLSSDDEIEVARREMAACRSEHALRPGSPAVDSWAFGSAAGVLFDTPFWKPNAASQGAFGTSWMATEAAWRANEESGPEYESRRQLPLLRDIFENPYRPHWADPTWLTWNNGTVVKLAEAIYQERAFDRMSILADSLEESGCNEADILGHCRQPGPHTRGCWVVDLLTGRS